LAALTTTLGERDTMVWGFMDIDGNVYLRSNKNDRKTIKYREVRKRPNQLVDLIAFFREIYPDVAVPEETPILALGE
jgi:hypothetical protein